MADKFKTTTTLEVSHNPVPHGQGFSVSAHVSWEGPHHVHGDVEFFADGESIAKHRTDSTGVVAYGVPGGLMKLGEHEFTATFHGDGYNEASTSEPLAVMLAPAIGEAVETEPEPEPETAPAPAPTFAPVDLTKPPEPAPIS